MEKYTAKQWAEIEGGHTVSEDKPAQFGFISDINEASKMYRTKQMVDGADLRDTLNFAFINLLTMQILYSDYNTAPIAQDYAKRTLVGGGNFKNYRRDGTDLYHALHKISTNAGVSGDKRATIQAAKTALPEQQLKQYLRAMASGQKIPGLSGLLMRMERGLDITEANYKAMRRLATSWNSLAPGQKQLLATRMLQYYRTNAIRSELYGPFKKFATSGGYINPNVNNVEKGITARKVATRAAAGTAAAVAGFALGRKFGRSLV